MKATINSSKHIVQHSIDTTASGVVDSITEITAVKVGDVDANNEVREGAVVKAVYFELWLRGNDSAAGSSFVFIVEKTSGNPDAPSAGNMAALDLYVNKKNIFFTSMGLSNALLSQATPILRQWIKIPKSKQRFGLGDRLKTHVFSQSGATLRCGVTIFKEYF